MLRPCLQWDRSRVATTLTGSALETHLQGEGPQGRDRDQCSHEEGGDVADGREGYAGSRALEALPGPVLRTRKDSAEGRTEQGLLRAGLREQFKYKIGPMVTENAASGSLTGSPLASPNMGTGAFSVLSTHACAVHVITTQNTKLQDNDVINTVEKMVGTK